MSEPAVPVVTAPRQDRLIGALMLAALVVFYAASSLTWALTDQVSPMWDQARHAWDALRLRHFLAIVLEHPFLAGDVLVWHDNYYVFLGYLPTALAHAVFGPSFDVAQAVMALFWTPVALLSTWWLVRQLLGSPLAALVGTAWLASSPLMADFAKDYLVDQPILALLALALALLVRSDGLHRPGWSAAFGAVAGGLVVVKAVAPAVFVVAPVVLSGARAWRRGTLAVWLRGAAWAAFGWSAVALPVHVRWREEFLRAVGWQQRAARVEGDPTSFLPSAGVHVHFLVDLQARGIMLPWLAWGAVRLWKTSRPLVLASLGCWTVSELAWTFYPNKDVRFCYPGLVYVAVLAGGAVVDMAPAARQRAVAAAALVVALLSTWNIQWGCAWMPAEITAGGWTFYRQSGYLRGRPDPAPSTPQQVVDAISADEDWKRVTAGKRVGLVWMDITRDEKHFNGWAVKHAAWINGHVVEMEEEPGTLAQMDFVILARCGAEAWPPYTGFEPMGQWQTPDGCTARLLRNAVLRSQESALRAAPPRADRYRADLVEQTLLAASLGASTARRGESYTSAFLVRADGNRRAARLKRTLRLRGGPLLATWETAEPRYVPGGEYVFLATWTLPDGVAPGEYGVELFVEGAGGPAHNGLIDVGTLRVEAP